MNNQDKQFFLTLGSRIASARKAKDLTQQQVAERLGIAQQAYAQYETGRERLPASMLPKLTQDLALTLDERMGPNGRLHSKPEPTPKLQQQIGRISQPPKATQQPLLSKMLDGVLAQAQSGH